MPEFNPVEVENRIREISERISRSVPICSGAYRTFLDADRAYSMAYARAAYFFEGPQWKARYHADLETEQERVARDAADVAYRDADRRAKALENELRAWQSVNASVREAYRTAGVGA